MKLRELRITATDIPGLYDAVLLDSFGDFMQDFRDLTIRQVEHVAMQNGAKIVETSRV